MKSWFLLPSLCLLAATTAASAKLDLERVLPVPADQPIPTQDFFRPPVMDQPVINRAGTHIATTLPADEGKNRLLLYELSTKKSQYLGTQAQDVMIGNVQWLGNSRLAFSHVDVESQELEIRTNFIERLMATDIDNLAATYPLQQFNGPRILATSLTRPEEPLVWCRYDRDGPLVVIKTDVRTTGSTALASGSDDVMYEHDPAKARDHNLISILKSFPSFARPEILLQPMADKTGALTGAVTALKGERFFYHLAGSKWVRTPVNLDEIDVIGAGNQPDRVLVAGPAKDGKPRPLQLMDAATGSFLDVVLQDASYDFNGRLYRNPSTGDILGAFFEKSGPRTYWFSPEYKALQTKLEGMFPKQIVQILGSDDQHQIFLVETFSDRQPRAYHWVDLKNQSAGPLQNTAPWIDPQRMRPMQIVQFKTRDGHKLDGYLTLPADASKENPAPLLVLCHDGPEGRDTWGFNAKVQFFAHHGYAVLQPNYRGSTGSIGRFPADVQYDFLKMHDDVTDAVNTVIGTGLIDKERVAIAGDYFGGYLALSGALKEPGLYRCAISNDGIYDWVRLIEDLKKHRTNYSFPDRIIRKLGDPKTAPQQLESLSLTHLLPGAKVPLLITYDKITLHEYLQQSYALLSTLEKQGSIHEKLVLGGDLHGNISVKHMVELNDHILAFLDQHLKPKK